ncbi:TetR/AcrR family transcriptional regulator [Sphingomonas sp. M1-B02]|uniref:TetR/AcrR family transcriptional regulator n=1 Tax=Sphingomonas sp. M1-B02 TaxID=3114300 RepID=UPI0022408DD2|nr:TetR/AcrR family transcriptional regulator [Sphingomonas sp. S6-11]UZK66706.1 TetR/AcrR family transcriptional regulator [Sphingomonas sp. S6-11]
MSAQRERILRATIRCIGDLGLEQTSIAAIRKEAELSTGAIYKHFTGKDEIVTAALQFAAMDQSDVPHHWPLLRDDMAALGDERGFDMNVIARTNLQLLASSLRPGPLRVLLTSQMEHTLSVLADRLTAMEQAGEIRLRMSPLRTANCIAALAEGLTWLGLASGRRLEEISRDIVAGLECLVDADASASVSD